MWKERDREAHQIIEAGLSLYIFFNLVSGVHYQKILTECHIFEEAREADLYFSPGDLERKVITSLTEMRD